MLAQKLGQSLTSNNAPAISPNTYSIQLTGTEYVRNNAAAAFTSGDAGSVSVWTKVSTMTSSGNLFRLRYDSNNFIQIMYHASSNEMRFLHKSAGTSRTIAITDAIENDGLWHHILATWNTTTNEIEIFLDGVSKASSTSALSAFGGTPSLFDIGQNNLDANFYKGYVTEFAFFSRVVAIGEVFVSKHQPINLTGMTDLQGYWKFNDGSGTLAHDSSGKGNTGTLVNSPAWTTDTAWNQ